MYIPNWVIPFWVWELSKVLAVVAQSKRSVTFFARDGAMYRRITNILTACLIYIR